MSDTVKLIIEIPKSALELLKTTGVDWLGAEHILSAVANGTPFEPCEDTISRSDVHKILNDCTLGGWVEVEEKIFHQLVNELPSVQPMRFQGEWTLISSVEELPEECLWVTRKGKDYCFVELIGWDSDRKCRTEDGGFRCSTDLKDVIAYMPYFEPKPYNEGVKE